MNTTYYVYIMSNVTNNVLYIGVTNDLQRRIYEHKNGMTQNSFSKKYKVNKLVHYEQYFDIRDAIAREKQLKNWERKWKMELIQKCNPEFDDIIIC